MSKRLLDLLALGTQDRTSAHKLADLVMEDYALTVNVLRMANSFHYNRSNHAIENVSHAIVVLGMDTSNVESVFVEGRPLKWQGKMVGVNVDRLLDRAEAMRLALYARAGIPLPGV